MVINKSIYPTEYFIAGLEREPDRKASAKLTKAIHNAFNDVFQALAVLRMCSHNR